MLFQQVYQCLWKNFGTDKFLSQGKFCKEQTDAEHEKVRKIPSR